MRIAAEDPTVGQSPLDERGVELVATKWRRRELLSLQRRAVWVRDVVSLTPEVSKAPVLTDGARLLVYIPPDSGIAGKSPLRRSTSPARRCGG